MKQRDIEHLRDLPNIGPAFEKKLTTLGIGQPADLIGKDPYQMYEDLSRIMKKRLDPCIIDVFISAVLYMEGGPAKKWWEYTAERKKHPSYK